MSYLEARLQCLSSEPPCSALTITSSTPDMICPVLPLRNILFITSADSHPTIQLPDIHGVLGVLISSTPGNLSQKGFHPRHPQAPTFPSVHPSLCVSGPGWLGSGEVYDAPGVWGARLA